MARSGKTPTLAEVAAANLQASGRGQIKAMVEAGKAIGIVAALCVCAQRTDGDWPSQRDYAAYWDMTERTAQREWALVRAAFPGEDGPDRIARAVYAEAGKRISSSPATALSLRVPDGLALAT